MLLLARRNAVTEAVRDQSLSTVSRTTSLISSELCSRPDTELVRKPFTSAPPYSSAYMSKVINILKPVQLRVGIPSTLPQAVAR